MKLSFLTKPFILFLLVASSSTSVAETAEEFDERMLRLFTEAQVISKNDIQAGKENWEVIINDLEKEFGKNHEFYILSMISAASDIVLHYDLDNLDEDLYQVVEKYFDAALKGIENEDVPVGEDLLWRVIFFSMRSDHFDAKDREEEKIKDAKLFFSYKPWEKRNKEWVAKYISALIKNMTSFYMPMENLEILNLVREEFKSDVIDPIILDIVEINILRVLKRDTRLKVLIKDVSKAYLRGVKIEKTYLESFVGYLLTSNSSFTEPVLNKYLKETKLEGVFELFQNTNITKSSENFLCEALLYGESLAALEFRKRMKELERGTDSIKSVMDSVSYDELILIYQCGKDMGEEYKSLFEEMLFVYYAPEELDQLTFDELLFSILIDAEIITDYMGGKLQKILIEGTPLLLFNKIENLFSRFGDRSNSYYKTLAAAQSMIITAILLEIVTNMDDLLEIEGSKQESIDNNVSFGLLVLDMLDEYIETYEDLEPYLLIQFQQFFHGKVELGIALGDKKMFDEGLKADSLLREFLQTEDFKNDPFRFYGNRDIERTIFNNNLQQLWLWASDAALDEGKWEELWGLALPYFQTINQIKSSGLINTIRLSHLKRDVLSTEQSELIKEFEKSVFEYRNLTQSVGTSLSDINLYNLKLSSRRALQESWSKLSDIAPLVNEKKYSLYDYMSHLEDNEYLISFLTFGDYIWVVTISNDFYHFYLASPGEKSFKEQIRSLRSEIINFESEFDDTHSKELYKNLLEWPLEMVKEIKGDSFNENSTVYLVPDQELYSLPFAALKTKEDVWLNNKLKLKLLATEQSLIENERKEKKGELRFVGFGDPKLPSQRYILEESDSFVQRGILDKSNFKYLSPLRETADELLEIKSYFNLSDVYLQEKASESNVKSGVLENADLIVFSSHALLPGEIKGVKESGIVLSTPEKATSLDDGFLTPSEIIQLNLNSPTVILSACNTAGPLQAEGETFSGLANAFFVSGAKSVIVSQWKVESFSTKTLITASIENSRENNYSFSEGLMRTQRQMSRGEFGREYKHPYFWSSFVSLGLN